MVIYIYECSVEIDLNFNATKYCVAVTPKLYKLALPLLHINHLPISYAGSIKYLGYIFSSDKCDDAEMLRQMRLLYCRSNRLIGMFYKCSQNVFIKLSRSFCTTLIGLTFGLSTIKLHFLSIELHTIMYIVMYLVSIDEAVPAKCLC